MAQQPEAEQNQQQQSQQQLRDTPHPPSDEDIEVIQAATPKHHIYERICSMVDKFATTRIGQFVIERGDSALRVIEDTARWSLPQQEEHSFCKLERPLPWLPFLALIIALRFARIWLSVATLVIGNGPVMPNNVIYFLQTRRRKLRALRVRGMKVRHQREIEAKARRAQLELGFLEKLSKLISTAICHPGDYYEATMNVLVRHEVDSNQQTPPQLRLMGPIQRAKRRRSDDDIANLTCDQMLSKYANEDSEDDSDFVPNADDYDGSSSSGNNTSFGTTTDDTLESDGGTMENENESAKKGESNDQNISKSERKTLDQSVEMSNEHSTGRKILVPKPIHEIKKETFTDIESGSEPLTPIGNGPNNGGEQRGEGDVASQAGNMLPSTTCSTNAHSTNFHLLNGNADASEEHKKSTPGHESAAQSQPRLILPLFGVTATTTIESNDQSMNADDVSNDESNTPSSPPSSCSNTSSSSYSSLPSFMASDDDLIINESFSLHDYDEAQTPTPTSDHFDSSILSSASSSEDIFYSPIGSPPNFNATYKPVSILKKPSPKQSNPNQADAHHSTPKGTEESATSDTVNRIDTSSKLRKHQHHQSQRSNVRYGGKNRH